MINIVKVTNKKLMREFVLFPVKLYDKNPYFVPIFTGDELKMLNPEKNPTLKDCEAEYYVAYKDGKAAGRIGAILHRDYNKRNNKQNVRFTRFDCIDDLEVAKALFSAVEDFAKSRGMNTVHGPYGFNETDRSGYLIEGFDKIANIGTNYNYPYYDALIEKCGYGKESNWLELEILPDEKILNKFSRISSYVLKHSRYKIAQEKTFKEFAKKYGWKAFECFNNAYADLPGFIPFTKELYEQIAAQFSLIINTRYMCAVLDENDDVIGFAVCFPSIGGAVQKAKGNIFPFGFIRILSELKKTKSLELCLIGVKKEHQAKGVNGVMIHHILKNLMEDGFVRTEAYPQFEDNDKTLAQWEYFNPKVIKRRKIVIKVL